MAITGFHPETNKWLTSFGADAKAGDTHTISFTSRSPAGRTCEFTTYVLAEPVAHDEHWGDPLFDLDECAAFFPPTGEPLPRAAS